MTGPLSRWWIAVDPVAAVVGRVAMWWLTRWI
jgi:hypothetical protein